MLDPEIVRKLTSDEVREVAEKTLGELVGITFRVLKSAGKRPEDRIAGIAGLYQMQQFQQLMRCFIDFCEVDRDNQLMAHHFQEAHRREFIEAQKFYDEHPEARPKEDPKQIKGPKPDEDCTGK